MFAPWTHLSAEEPALAFLRAAQEQGYGEASLDYLEQLQAAGRLPAELKETWDLELSRSYRAAVAEAFNAAEAEAQLAKAQTHLDKFLREHPDHPAVAGAMESISVGPKGKMAQSKIDAAEEDEWVKWNKEMDKLAASE